MGSFDQNTNRVIVKNHILPFIYDMHGGTNKFVLLENNSGSNLANYIATYLKNEKVTSMK